VVSIRYHLVSLAAVLFALAAGVVLGAGPLTSVVDAAVPARTTGATTSAAATAALAALRARAAWDDAFVAAAAKGMVAGRLRKAGVVLVVAPGTPPALVTATADMVALAGGTVTGQVRLTDAWTDPAQATVLTGITSQLAAPGGSSAASTPAQQAAAALAGAILTTRPSQVGKASDTATALLAGLSQGGFLSTVGHPAQAASLAVLLTPAQVPRAGGLVPLAEALDLAGSGAVTAGTTGSAAPAGLVGQVRADPTARAAVSTVDCVDLPACRVSTVLALARERAGQRGQYGSGPGAGAPLPPG
jgi:Copper transport outer membrane protein, MctB